MIHFRDKFVDHEDKVRNIEVKQILYILEIKSLVHDRKILSDRILRVTAVLRYIKVTNST